MSGRKSLGKVIRLGGRDLAAARLWEGKSWSATGLRLTWRPQDLGRGGDVGQPVLAAIQVMLTFQDVEPSSQVVGPVSCMPSRCVWL
jgi:hypothetical protein